MAAQHDPYAFAGLKPTPAKLITMTRGLAVPITFSLGGDQGDDVLAAGSPTATAVTCPALKQVPAKNAHTAKRSSFAYKPATGRYKYVWKSPAAAGCVDVTIRLIDGSSHTVHFKLL